MSIPIYTVYYFLLITGYVIAPFWSGNPIFFCFTRGSINLQLVDQMFGHCSQKDLGLIHLLVFGWSCYFVAVTKLLQLSQSSVSSVQLLSRVRLSAPHESRHARPPCPSQTPWILVSSKHSTEGRHERKVKVKSLSRVPVSVTPWTVAS